MLEELILIRHGEASHLLDDNNLTGGWTDTELTETGIKQAISVSKKIKSMISPNDWKLYSSDLSRALNTASFVSKETNLTINISKELREINNGIAKNMTKKEAKTIINPIISPLANWRPYKEGETWLELYQRTSKFMNLIMNEDFKKVIIVSHGGTMANIVHWWLKLPESHISFVFYEFEPCSITYLKTSEYGERTISKLNDTSYST